MGVQSPETRPTNTQQKETSLTTPLYGMNANNSNNSNSSPAKKRKANDGRAATDCAHDVNKRNTNDGGGFLSTWFGYFSGRRDDAASGSPNNENLLHQSLSKMDKMEQMMMRMEEKMTGIEEKLSTVGSIERRCEQLEKKCSSLETMLESTKKHIDKKIDSLDFDLDQKCDSLADRLVAKVDAAHEQEAAKALKRHEYNEMLIKNQGWDYSVPVLSVDDFIHNGYSVDEAEYLSEAANELKDATTRMRRGEFTCYIGGNDVYVRMSDEDPPFDYAVNNELLPHWEEFAAALEQFTPAINILPDDCESSFRFYYVQLNHAAIGLIKNALVGMPFKSLAFSNNNNGNGVCGGMSVDSILDIAESNKHLRKLLIGRNHIGSHHFERLCDAVRNHPTLVELVLFGSFEPGIGDEMLASLLSIDDLKLERLDMSENHITSAVGTLLADFVATNTTLKELDVMENNLTDIDAELLANALRSNSTLRELRIDYNNISEIGFECFHRVLCDESSLNSVADSNHVCSVLSDSSAVNDWNLHEDNQINRGWKIYYLLSTRHKTTSNAQHFGDIDLKILPDMLDAVQKYKSAARLRNWINDSKVDPLSIVYEIMRKWDKAISLYKSLGAKSIENE